MKMDHIRGIIAATAGLLCALLLTGCAATAPCAPDYVRKTLQKSDEVQGYIYAEGIMMDFQADAEFLKLLDGDWTAQSKGSSKDKILSVIVDTQYELCFFADGSVMIYYGYTDIFEKDRQYYQLATTEDVSAMVAYILEHGTVAEEEDSRSIPSVE